MFGQSDLLDVVSTLPPGWPIQSAFNLELLTANNPPGKGRMMACDGRDINRSQVDKKLAAQNPAGVFTSTARTLAATASAGTAAIDASPTYFVTGAAQGTTAAQYSTDGATWSQTSLVSAASTSVVNIFWNGIRWFFGCAAAAQGVYVTTGDNPNSTWTGVTNITEQHAVAAGNSFAYSSSLALTISVPDTAGTSVYSIPDGSTTATARTVTSATKMGICWTGQKFIILTTTAAAPLHTSTDGTTWADAFPAGYDTSAALTIASDGNGAVVIAYPLYFLVSNDHGATWGKKYPPLEFLLTVSENAMTGVINRVKYVNNRFVAFAGSSAATTLRIAMSFKGNAWFVEPIGYRGVAQRVVSDLAFKSNVYCGVRVTTAAITATENPGQMRLPAAIRNISGTAGNFEDFQTYIKVAM